MATITQDMVGGALQDAARLWAENYKLVLQDTRFPQLPGAGEDPLFKAFAWINFGVNTTKELFPKSGPGVLIGQLAKRWNVPLYIIGVAQTQFKSYVDSIIASANTKLIEHFTKLRDAYTDHVDRQAAAFYRTPYYTRARDEVFDYLKNRTFAGQDGARGFAYELIVNSDYIDVRQQAIREAVDAGFKGLCEKVFMIYRSWHDRAGDDMYYASSPAEVARNERDAFGQERAVIGTREYKPVRIKSDVIWILANAWQMEVRHVDEPWWIAKPDRTYVTNMGASRARLPVTMADAWPTGKVDLAAAEQRMAATPLPRQPESDRRRMFKYAQDKRWLRIDTPLGDDVLLVSSIKGREAISALFHFTIDLLSESEEIDPAVIVGANVTVSVHNLDDSLRYFNGFVRQFSSCGTDDRLSRYQAEIVPWPWFLTRTTDCRIFQNRSVPEIIEQVFGDLGFSGYETSEIRGSHPKREYCVQYRESDFDFVSRLMEEEGIFYFFRHEDGQHVMVLADHAGAYVDAADREVRMLSPMGSEQLGDEITAWEHRHEFRSGKWTHTDYNFKTPSTDLAAAAGTVVKGKDAGRYELFDYPGRYQAKAEGDELARLRMEEQEVPHDTVAGAGKCRSFTAGARFRLSEHPARSEAGRSYAITSVEHAASQRGAYTSGGSAAEEIYSNTFTCIRDDVPFRPARTTPRPVVRGAQTAVVVGPSGEEIYTDEFGRVKVQFHWDREGQRDENSSCWIRVAQPWAGKRWGVIFLPRIGQEVVVEFLEGDPDRPLITGSVYNAEQMPPYELPEHKTRSAIKTLSSKGGEGWNEIRFEDRKDEEQIFIHAERDQDTRVKHDSREWVGNERHLIVGDGEEGTGNQSELVRGSKQLNVKKDHVEKIEGDMTLTIGHGDGGGGNVNIVIEQDKHELIEKNSHVHVKADRMEQVDGMQGLSVKGDDVRQVGGNFAITAGGVIQLACKKLVISASAGMTIKGPGGFVDVGAGGVTIQGTVVRINSGGSAGDGITPPRTEARDALPGAPAAPAEAADDRPGLVSAPEASGPGPPARS